jgi:primosomal protein N' (replication factor Y)
LCNRCKERVENVNFCPYCGSVALECKGAGSERVEDWLHNFFPKTKVMRMQKETFSKKEGAKTLKAAQIVIATTTLLYQNIPKNVGLLAILCADFDILHPQFDCCEDAFQHYNNLLNLCRPKEFLIQTFSPFHYLVRSFQKGFEHFYKKELSLRRKLHYPPFSKAFTIYIKDADYVKNVLECEGLQPFGPKRKGGYDALFLIVRKSTISTFYNTLSCLRKEGKIIRVMEEG